MIFKLNRSLMFYKYKRKFKNIINQCSQQCFSDKSHGKQLNILFFGTDNFSLPSLQLLHKEKNESTIIDRLTVVTSFKSQIKSVLKYAQQNKIEYKNWPLSIGDCNGYDLGVVVSFGHLIPESIISSFPLGMINVHASLLPRWRGAAPIIYAILNGDKTTGVSIMRIKPKVFDIGEILNQKSVDIRPNILMPELHDTLAKEGASLLLNTLHNFPFVGTPQSDNGVTYAPKVHPTMSKICWQSMNSDYIYNLYRALYSFMFLQTKWQNVPVKFYEISKLPKTNHDYRWEPGTVEYVKQGKYLRIFCADGQCIAVHRLSMVGRKEMSAADFNNGFVKKIQVDSNGCFQS